MFWRVLRVRTMVNIILWRHTSHQTIASTMCGSIWRFQAIANIILCKHECQTILNTILNSIVCRVWRVHDIILWRHSSHQTIANAIRWWIWRLQTTLNIIFWMLWRNKPIVKPYFVGIRALTHINCNNFSRLWNHQTIAKYSTLVNMEAPNYSNYNILECVEGPNYRNIIHWRHYSYQTKANTIFG